MHNIAIIGATGFTGSELVRILHLHPEVEISLITSESHKGKSFSDIHPFFKGIVDMELDSIENAANYEIDLAFLALPHGISMSFVQRFRERGIPVVDLSGDFRLSSPAVYSEWYGIDHTYSGGFDESVYGIPELFENEISSSGLIANPGCYPTSVILAIAPLLREGFIDPEMIIADSKSGITGAGIKAKPVNHFASVNDNFRAYGLKSHRHTIEIQEQLEQASGATPTIQFTPHLLPVDRGILSTTYVRPVKKDIEEALLAEIYDSAYGDKPFIRRQKEPPSIKHVRGTNFCDIYSTYDPRTGNIIVISAIDNLVKGAAGQAVQNMNLVLGLDETSGLNQIPVYP